MHGPLFWLEVSGWVLALLVLIGVFAYLWPDEDVTPVQPPKGNGDQWKGWR